MGGSIFNLGPGGYSSGLVGSLVGGFCVLLSSVEGSELYFERA